MPEIESLSVRFEADLNSFKREFDGIDRIATKSAAGIEKSFSDLFSELERDSESLSARLSDVSFDMDGVVDREFIKESTLDLQAAQGDVRSLNGAARDLGFTFASAFEDAVVEGRRLSDVLRGLEQDILRILTRKLVTEPLAGAVTGLLGEGQGLFADLFHGGGTVGATAVSGRVVPASLFDGAPRFAGGGIVPRSPRLAPGEVPAILHRGEVVRTPAQEAALQRRIDGGVTIQPGAIVIQTPSPRAFNESRGQIEAMLADAVRRGRRFR